MQTLLCLTLGLSLVCALSAQEAVPIPVLTARTSVASSKSVRSSVGANTTQSQAVRSTGVSVNVSFYQPPRKPYEIQCFFVAKNEGTKERYIFESLKQQAQGRAATAEFVSSPLMGTSTQTTAIPFSGRFDGVDTAGNYVSGKVTGATVSSNTASGSKMEGWIVRVVYQGQVLRIESNQPQLIDIAKGSAEAFDKAIGGVK